ncbi:hypothetical protein M7I_1994 [Glarea lozoyensis 74030]|uniref:2EXR domain-containing protein n=1 Tax=Glarea lozoyensis (strain ATCC 74030 / MF5533) TaxID=1104152 RepID=H0EHL1_GLAL7|nr:hypothetical protein M7I_1994 [Glarea lozoyensis 74030]
MEVASSPASPPTFTKFLDLPTELRLKIWAFTAPGPRNVRIRYKGLPDTIEEMNDPRVWPYTSSEPVPAAFHVCQESRAEAQKRFPHKPCFGTRNHHHEAMIYFDFSQDTLVFEGDARDPPINYTLGAFLYGRWTGADDCDKVERLSIGVTEDNYTRSTFIWDEIRRFAGLEELIFYDLDGHLSDKRDVVHPQWKLPKIAIKSKDGIQCGQVDVFDTENWTV